MSEPETHDEHIAALREHWLTDGDLAYLRGVDVSLLARIRRDVEAHARRVHDGQRRLYEVMAKATRFIPNFMIVRMSGSLSPYVLAQITEHLEPKTAAGLTKSFDAQLLGDIVVHLETRVAASIASHTDVDTLVQITDILRQKGFVKRLGEVSDALDHRMLEKLVQRIRDPESIAAVAAHMRAHDKLSAVAGRLDAKLRAAVVAVLEKQGHVHAVRAIAG
jgi:ribosomal protein S8